MAIRVNRLSDSQYQVIAYLGSHDAAYTGRLLAQIRRATQWPGRNENLARLMDALVRRGIVEADTEYDTDETLYRLSDKGRRLVVVANEIVGEKQRTIYEWSDKESDKFWADLRNGRAVRYAIDVSKKGGDVVLVVQTMQERSIVIAELNRLAIIEDRENKVVVALESSCHFRHSGVTSKMFPLSEVVVIPSVLEDRYSVVLDHLRRFDECNTKTSSGRITPSRDGPNASPAPAVTQPSRPRALPLVAKKTASSRT